MHAILRVLAAAPLHYPSNPRMSGKLPYLIIGGAVLFFLVACLGAAVTYYRRKARLERIEEFHRRRDREGEDKP